MIVDCHTHIWVDEGQLGPGAAAHIRRQCGLDGLVAGPEAHAAAAKCVQKSLVFAFRSAHLQAHVPNDLVAEYVRQNAEKMIGIAAVDPTLASAAEDAACSLEREEFGGLTVSPSEQNFHPTDSRAIAIYELARQERAPVFFAQGTHFSASGKMEYARPSLLDEIATEYPDLTIVITSLGHPWIEEGIAIVGKHPRVYADIAGLIRRPWQAYNALVLAHQFNVTDKVLFGSDFPYLEAARAIETVYRLHEVTQGTNLPSVPREVLRGIVERDALSVLGIAPGGGR